MYRLLIAQCKITETSTIICHDSVAAVASVADRMVNRAERAMTAVCRPGSWRPLCPPAAVLTGAPGLKLDSAAGFTTVWTVGAGPG